MGTKRDGYITVSDFVIGEEIPDDVAFITQAEDKLRKIILGIMFHDMPENRSPADFDHGFRFEFGFLPKSCPEATAKNDDFHWSAQRLKAMMSCAMAVVIMPTVAITGNASFTIDQPV